MFLAQLRTGECKLVGKFRQRLNLGSICRWCDRRDETIFHLFEECDNVEIRQLKLKYGIKSISVLTQNPRNGILFVGDALSSL